MTEEEKKAADEKAKKDAEEKERQEAFLKAKQNRDDDDDDDIDERLERIRREKDFLDEMFAPVKELLDEWTEFKTESNWSPKSKRPSPTTEMKPPEPEKKSNSIFSGFSGKGGLWDL